MTIKPSPETFLLSRKDIARMLNVSPRMVANNEQRWGLRIARTDLNRRCVRYCACMAMMILKSRKFVH